jgi:glycogen operon protein
MRNFLATLFLSQGVPMLVAGDERARTQHGNNNAYCQDNEISWLDWSVDERRSSLLEFTQRLIRLRQEHPVFRRNRFLEGVAETSGLPDVYWFRPDGRRMTRRDWDTGPPLLGVFLNGAELGTRTLQGEPVVDDSFLILFNAHHEDAVFTLPPRRFGTRWMLELSTAEHEPGERRGAREEVTLQSRSLLVYRRD